MLKSLDLISTDLTTKEEGITLAAILLFGTEYLILTVLPWYKTDAIFRIVNLDRYDDRDVVCTNLIESFDRLMAFGKKLLQDIVILDNISRVSTRDSYSPRN